MTAILRQIAVDGISIETTDQGAQAITKLQDQVARLTTTHAADIARLQAEAGTAAATNKAALDAKDGEIAALKAKVVTDEQLDAMAAARAAVIDVAKTVLGAFDAKGKSTLDIKKAVVEKTLGADGVKDKSPEYIAAAFDVAAKGADTARGAHDGARDFIRSGQVTTGDAATQRDTAHREMVTGLQDAWKNPAGTSAARQ